MECVNSRAEDRIETFSDFMNVYIGDNIGIIDECGDESDVFNVYESLSEEILDVVKYDDPKIEEFVASETGMFVVSNAFSEEGQKEVATLRSQVLDGDLNSGLATSTPVPEQVALGRIAETSRTLAHGAQFRYDRLYTQSSARLDIGKVQKTGRRHFTILRLQDGLCRPRIRRSRPSRHHGVV